MDALKKKRQVVKGAITRIYSVCQNSEASVDDIKARMSRLEILFQDYDNIQNEIDTLTSQNDMAAEETYRKEVEEKYYEIQSLFLSKTRLEDGNQTIVENVPASNDISEAVQALMLHQTTMSSLIERMSANTITNSTPNPPETSFVSTQHAEIRLPPIQIPEFDGSFKNWIRFRDLFESIIHNRESLSQIEKFEYLQSRLSKDALSLIKHLSPSNENYGVAWKLLKDRYNNDDKIKRPYIEALFSLPIMKSVAVAEVKLMYNTINESVNALKALNEPVEHWNTLLLYMFEKKLDSDSLSLWYRKRNDFERTTVAQFLKFLEQRLCEAECIKAIANQSSRSNQVNLRNQVCSTTLQSCPNCSENHALFSCNEFQNLNIDQRQQFVQEKRLCFNCFGRNHQAKNCQRSSCRTCGAKHNTMLHKSVNVSNVICEEEDTSSASGHQNSVNIHTSHHFNNAITLLPTAIVSIFNNNGQTMQCRALLDSGAQVSLISEKCAQHLQLPRTHNTTKIYGVGSNQSCYTRGKVHLALKIRNSTIIETEALCLSSLTQCIPGRKITNEKLNYFKNLQLADPKFKESSAVDVILGADVFSECVLSEKIIHPSGAPAALNTVFGWVIVGKIGTAEEASAFIINAAIDIGDQLQKFWEIEEIDSCQKIFTDEEKQAEEHFEQHVIRDVNGRFVVRLPFKQNSVELGDSKVAAMKRLNWMERKFENNPKLETDYKQFMEEYMQLGHMEKSKNLVSERYLLPHHAILKPCSTTTRLRVVFDASCKTRNGKSLNDQLLVGPTVQNDLITILMRFRKFQIAFSGDIEKMYRQIIIHEDDRRFQRIMWREDRANQPEEYELKTVTYGTSCAPFLATRCLIQAANEAETNFPEAANAIKECFYVDDLIGCAESINEGVKLKTEISNILKNAGFHLRKWSSNSVTFLDTIDPENREVCKKPLMEDVHEVAVKTLGLMWDTENDYFTYRVCLTNLPLIVTKRIVLSEISKVFDPLGWLSPIVIAMKIFLQSLWLIRIDWDEPLPKTVLDQWLLLRKEIPNIASINIPRWLNYANGFETELHGFADASESAYSAVVYLKVQRPDGSIATNLIAAKTKVAPVKQISLPRLELCGAQLLVKLMKKVTSSLDFTRNQYFAYSDSTIVLAWLSDHPRRWKTFVANRTSFIIDFIPPQQWRHISSCQNPADLATRGIMPSELVTNELWWNGPEILKQPFYNAAFPEVPEEIDMETRNVLCFNVTANTESTIIERYSEYSKLLRTVALILRFVHNCKTINNHRSKSFLTTKELQIAHATIIRFSQNRIYKTEIHILQSGKQLSPTHSLVSLAPFVDNCGILRVGGRIENANVAYDQKHPIILSKDEKLTEILIDYYHKRNLHAGSRQLQYIIGLKYWIPGVNNVIKRIIHKCVTCMRYRAKSFEQQMGNLPKERLTATFAFQQTGVDFAGPLQIRSWKGRGSKTYKCWIALFVCLVTKAAHLELVTELSTPAFISTLKRFVSRRGKPTHIFSDNGTNFVGTNQQLRELQSFLNHQHTQEAVAKHVAEDHIEWHFSPPSGPHFGGMWEAGVKSMKYHLRRVLRDVSATFEEMYTVLCQIENCLNSRPLCIKFIGDVDPLTPAHFLIMHSMHALPEYNYTDIGPSHLKRWQYLERLVQLFWKKWSIEYLHQMQQRPKWRQKLQNLKCDDVVLIKDDNQPPTYWQIGRIVDIHPGKDGLVRVVSVKTSKGTVKRPIVKLCPLFEEC